MNLLKSLSFLAVVSEYPNKNHYQAPGEPREHHLGELLQGRSKSKFNIIPSYLVLYLWVQGSIIQNYLEIK